MLFLSVCLILVLFNKGLQSQIHILNSPFLFNFPLSVALIGTKLTPEPTRFVSALEHMRLDESDLALPRAKTDVHHSLSVFPSIVIRRREDTPPQWLESPPLTLSTPSPRVSPSRMTFSERKQV